jgi:DnaJ-class molecular chaperone
MLGGAILAAGSGLAQTNTRCLLCHGKPGYRIVREGGGIQSLFIDGPKYSASLHGRLDCTACHIDALAIPHRKLRQVNCVQCHYEANVVGAPKTIKYQQYKESVHGKAHEQGNPNAPVCQDCHGSHYVFSHTDPASPMSRANIARDVCAGCHVDIYSTYRESVHGVALVHGKLDSPTCTDCHGEHSIFPPSDSRSSIYPRNVVKTCPRCHGSEAIAKRAGLPTEPVSTYKESFHGVASEYGMTTVADCASCHGYHDIRPSWDPRSTISKQNLQKTCGRCHPGAGKRITEGKIHIEPEKREAGVVYYIYNFFRYITLSVFILLAGHIVLDLRVGLRDKRAKSARRKANREEKDSR